MNMVDIIPKKRKKALPWNKIAYGTGAFLAAVVLSYGILFFFSDRASSELDGLKDKIAMVGTPDDKIVEKAVLDRKKKIEDFADLLSGRILSAGFFGNLETIIHPKVWLSSFDLDIQKMELTASAQTVNFQTLGQQLAIFKKDKNVKQVDLTNVSMGKEGDVEFGIYLYFNPEMFSQ